MLAGFLLNGYQTAIPELAPFANLTWFGWTAESHPAGRPVRLGVAGPRRRRDGRRCSSRESRPSPAATSALATALPGPRLPDFMLGLARTPRSGQQRAIPDRPGVGRRPRPLRARHRQLGPIVHRADRRFADVRAGAVDALPGHRHGDDRRVPAARLRRVRPRPRRARRRRHSSAAGRPTRRSGRMEMLLPTPVAESRWPLSGGIAVFAAIGGPRGRHRRRDSPSAPPPPAERCGHRVLGTAGDRPVRCRPGRSGHGDRWSRSARASPPRPSSPSRS